mmetsp:Transcript_160310/g.282875  ORF Transcript_160310/g.282875 Transcript_160310/m.282875 type:complete len:88 (-) Transcript_160310:417-680(-)
MTGYCGVAPKRAPGLLCWILYHITKAALKFEEVTIITGNANKVSESFVDTSLTSLNFFQSCLQQFTAMAMKAKVETLDMVQLIRAII